MNNYTKEYIKECDCKEIQNIKQEGITALDKGDWIYIKNASPLIEETNFIVDMIMDSGG